MARVPNHYTMSIGVVDIMDIIRRVQVVMVGDGQAIKGESGKHALYMTQGGDFRPPALLDLESLR